MRERRGEGDGYYQRVDGAERMTEKERERGRERRESGLLF